MLDLHQPKNGPPMVIAQMSAKHLRNTIKFKLRKAIALQNSVKQARPLTEVEKGLYQIEALDPRDVGAMIREIMRDLYPYLAAAYYHGVDSGIKKMIQQALDFPLPPDHGYSEGDVEF